MDFGHLPGQLRLAQRLLHLDPPSTALNATQVIWRFFAAHPRPRSG
jgi:polyhydroxybutyrate depolymerase